VSALHSGAPNTEIKMVKRLSKTNMKTNTNTCSAKANDSNKDRKANDMYTRVEKRKYVL
jgi:hypothetical protein